jgi:hypothetical protein
MNVGSKVFGKEDNQGNRLLVRGFYDEYKKWTFASVHLKLVKMDKPRLLGYVDVQEATLYVTRQFSKRHYHYKKKGFGFNWELLSGNLIDIQTINLKIDDDTQYVFPKSIIKDYGTFMNYNDKGFEVQRLIRFDLIKRYQKHIENDTKINFIEIAK